MAKSVRRKFRKNSTPKLLARASIHNARCPVTQAYALCILKTLRPALPIATH